MQLSLIIYFIDFFKGPIILLEAGQSGSFTSRGNRDMHLVKSQQSIKDVLFKKNCQQNKRSIRASIDLFNRTTRVEQINLQDSLDLTIEKLCSFLQGYYKSVEKI